MANRICGRPYRVLSQKNERGDIFRDDPGRLMFLDVIEGMSDQYEVDILAYTLDEQLSYFLTNKSCQSFQNHAIAGTDIVGDSTIDVLAPVICFSPIQKH